MSFIRSFECFRIDRKPSPVSQGSLINLRGRKLIDFDVMFPLVSFLNLRDKKKRKSYLQKLKGTNVFSSDFSG